MNEVINRGHKTENYVPKEIKNKTGFTNNPKEMCNILNYFFISVGKNISDSINNYLCGN